MIASRHRSSRGQKEMAFALQNDANEAAATKARQIFELVLDWNPKLLVHLRPDVSIRSKVDWSCRGYCIDENCAYHSVLESSDNRQHSAHLAEAGQYLNNLSPKIVDCGHGVTEYYFDNIYALLLFALRSKTDFGNNSHYFRGQRDARWSLVPSSCRDHCDLLRKDLCQQFVLKTSGGSRTFDRHLESHWPRDLRVLEERLAREQPEKYEIFHRMTDQNKKESVIQHYLSGTPWIDLTRSLFVAAFFATQDAQAGDTGAIYNISSSDLSTEGSLVSYEDVPTELIRIHRQFAGFLRLHFPALVDYPAHLSLVFRSDRDRKQLRS